VTIDPAAATAVPEERAHLPAPSPRAWVRAAGRGGGGGSDEDLQEFDLLGDEVREARVRAAVAAVVERIEDEITEETPAPPAEPEPRTNEIAPREVPPDPLAHLPLEERIDKRLWRMQVILEKWDQQESKRVRDPVLERALDEGQEQLRVRGKAACLRSARAVGELVLDYATSNPGNALKTVVSVPVLAWTVGKFPDLVEIVWDWGTVATGLAELWR
jgi:hypothetical protein